MKCKVNFMDTKNTVVIDGSLGEGGGQIFRTSLTLAMCLGKAVRIENIRAGRNKPGLLRQHLICLRAAKTICGAQVAGDELGSQQVSFMPHKVKTGDYHFAVGSAGSTTLVFQTLFLPLALADERSVVRIEGGTHNGMAPSFDFIEQCFLPVVKRMGCDVAVELLGYGFYPAGGGDWSARINPVSHLKRLLLTDSGNLMGQTAVATSARIPAHVTERELAYVQKKCDWQGSSLHRRLVKSAGPGNIFSLRLAFENLTDVIEVVGERNISAERVAERAIAQMTRLLTAKVAVGEYLADQLLLPMALGAGGEFLTVKPSQHFISNVDVIKKFMDIEINYSELAEDRWLVKIGRSL